MDRYLTSGYKQYILDNGLIVALQPSTTETLAGRLRFSHGGVHESKGEEGLAHFTEHAVMSGGGSKYPASTMLEVLDDFEEYGALTSSFETSYFFDLFPKTVESYFDFISDVAFTPLFDPAAVDNQRGIILTEINNRKSSPLYPEKIAFNESFYGKGSPHGSVVFGDEQVIRNSTADSLRNFHSRGYSPNNADLVIVGNLPDNIETLVDQAFSNIPVGEKETKIVEPPAPITSSTVLHRIAPYLQNLDSRDDSMAHLLLGLRAPTLTSPDYCSSKILAQVLGGSLTSLIPATLRGEMEVAYSINAQHSINNNNGVIMVDGSIQASYLEKSVDAIFDVMNSLQNTLVRPELFNRSKNKVNHRNVKFYGKDSGLISAVEDYIDYSISPDDLLKGFWDVSRDDVREAARKYLPSGRNDSNYVLLLQDPLKDE